MNRQRRLVSRSRAQTLRRLCLVGATALLALVASVSILAVAVPSRAQADPASPAAPVLFWCNMGLIFTEIDSKIDST